MGRSQKKQPTTAELEILRVLWRRGPSSVREVYNDLRETRSMGYTTVLKLMQIMVEKGSATRDESVRPQIYRSERSERHTQKQMLGDLLDQVFHGSPGKLVLQALSSKGTTAEERAEIRRLLDRLEEKEGSQ